MAIEQSQDGQEVTVEEGRSLSFERRDQSLLPLTSAEMTSLQKGYIFICLERIQ